MEEGKYIEEVTEMKCAIKELMRNVDILKKKQNETFQLSIDLKLLTSTVGDLALIVKELKEDMKEIKGQSGKRWNSLMSIVASTSIGAIIMYFISTFILK